MIRVCFNCWATSGRGAPSKGKQTYCSTGSQNITKQMRTLPFELRRPNGLNPSFSRSEITNCFSAKNFRFKGSCCESGRAPGAVHRVSQDQMKAFGSQRDYEVLLQCPNRSTHSETDEKKWFQKVSLRFFKVWNLQDVLIRSGVFFRFV